MLAVHSYWDCNFKSPKKFAALAELSHKFLKLHGYQTKLFIDSNSYSLFKHIAYDEIIFIDEAIKNLPPGLWAANKLAVYTLLNEPFVHFDFDIFLFNDPIKLVANKSDLFCLHEENCIISSDRLFFNNLATKDIWSIKTPNSYNCGVFGGNNYKLISETSKELLEQIMKNKEKLFGLNGSFLKCDMSWIEQTIFIHMLLQKDMKLNTLFTPKHFKEIRQYWKKYNIFHLWGMDVKEALDLWGLKYDKSVDQKHNLALFLQLIDQKYFS